MKIVSRVSPQDEQDVQLGLMQDILEAGYWSMGVDYEMDCDKPLAQLVDEFDHMTVEFMERVENLEADVEAISRHNDKIGAKLTEYELTIDKVNAIATAEVDYDEDLDHAVQDLMDSLTSSGAATTAFDGDIAFEDGLVLTKGDLKPHLRLAIEAWLRLKVR